MKIYMWPNGDWCIEDDFETFSLHLGDDYQTMICPEHITKDDIDEFVVELISKGLL